MKMHVAPTKKTAIASNLKQYRHDIFTARARVESPFGAVKQKFKSLSKPFAEDDEQLENVVTMAVGIHNFNL